MPRVTVPRTPQSTPDFLSYLRSSPVTEELADALTYIVEERHRVASLERHRAGRRRPVSAARRRPA